MTTPVARAISAATLGCLLLAGCGGGYEPAGPFREQAEGPPPQVGPPVESSPAPVPGEPSTPGSQDEQDGDPAVVATGLAVPTGIALLPDGTAVVGERDTGRLLQVFPDRSPAQELMTLPGVDGTGDGGLLGLAVSPTFAEDGLLYAYVSTPTDNRVVRFPLGGTPNPVVTGIPRGEVHNGGGLLFGLDGTLFVGTGDVGNPALAADPASLAGKVLAVDVFGQPVGTGPVYTSGHQDVTAICTGDGEQLYATDDSLTGPDELNALQAGGAYGSDGTAPVLTVPAEDGGLGGCAVAGPYVLLGALDGQRVHVVELDGTGVPVEEPEPFLADEYGRLRSLALDAQGALWITTSNRDGVGTPVEDDDRVLRVQPPAAGGGSPL
ncbi:PQQ-dependent sugar dehydrogenase [Modestobacter italicus]|uniref:PQQ-dependent sugar dehydrogenase n=1 Tax=Modestobacter italicus (strain DSM 44449 / CECT 9708 / BC 501) TaxID=2732864 RepID=UPI001C97B1AC|nr:PQQ-dependent sugar dehydrogenase [Modestobacter italicus]